MTENFDEAEAAGKAFVDHLYRADFHSGAGSFFNFYTMEDGNPAIDYEPPFPSRSKIKITVTFLKEKGDIKTVTIKKFKQYKRGWEEQMWGPDEPLTFTWFSFQKIAAFLRFISEADLASMTDRRVALKVASGPDLDPELTGLIKNLLNGPDGQQLIEDVLTSGDITSRDLVNISFRKAQLKVFEQLLSDPDYVAIYREQHSLTSSQAEKAWQHFFKRNEWIFGYGLDYRFMGIIQDEADVAIRDTVNRGGSVGDFLMGFSDFTVLVELKLPATPLFTGSTDRGRSWRLSADFVAAVSQILEQKASWQIKAEVNAAFNYTREGNLIHHRTLDPKCILIVGSSEDVGGSEMEQQLKKRTFELFRRDSRNVEIVTYNELLERARFIVGNSAQC